MNTQSDGKITLLFHLSTGSKADKEQKSGFLRRFRQFIRKPTKQSTTGKQLSTSSDARNNDAVEPTTSFSRRPSYRRAIKRASALDPDISSESAPSTVPESSILAAPPASGVDDGDCRTSGQQQPSKKKRSRRSKNIFYCASGYDSSVSGSKCSDQILEVQSTVLSPVPSKGSMRVFNGSAILKPQLFKPNQRKRPESRRASSKSCYPDERIQHTSPQMPHESDLFSMINHPSESDIEGSSGPKIIRQMPPQIPHESDLFSMINHPSESDGGHMDNCSMDNHAGEESSLGSHHPNHVSHRRSFNGSNSRRVDFRQKYRRYAMLYCQRLPTVMEDTKLEVIAFVWHRTAWIDRWKSLFGPSQD